VVDVHHDGQVNRAGGEPDVPLRAQRRFNMAQAFLQRRGAQQPNHLGLYVDREHPPRRRHLPGHAARQVARARADVGHDHSGPEVERLEQQVGKKYGFESILGESAIITEAISLAKKVAPTNATVLLLGETGTGKEVFAQAIHNGSKRAGNPFMALNCSAFGKELLESEIFGHKAGAFTGATKDKKGLIEEASTGTLFLDEIGEMHIDLQSKLLRVLETNEFIKVGDTKSTKVNVRVIAATNRNLENDVKEGKFREDLFYRINVFTITLPALRERKKDIPMLAAHFLTLFSQKTNSQINSMSSEFIERLQQHDWKGNIRELKNIMERAVILATGPQLSVDSLPIELQLINYKPQNLSAFDLASVEKLHIQRVLNHTKGNKTETAKLLNIGLTTLYRKIEEYGLT